jgi:two-component system cell cycle response regulator DivK
MGDLHLPKNILIIEDNEVNRKLVEVILTKSGYAVLSATDAEEGISLARREHPDLILMDIHLPGMDGLSATRILKGEPSTMDIPIIALTALAMKGDEERSLEAGCDDYVDKPIRHQSLVDAVVRLLKTGGKPHA